MSDIAYDQEYMTEDESDSATEDQESSMDSKRFLFSLPDVFFIT